MVFYPSETRPRNITNYLEPHLMKSRGGRVSKVPVDLLSLYSPVEVLTISSREVGPSRFMMKTGFAVCFGPHHSSRAVFCGMKFTVNSIPGHFPHYLAWQNLNNRPAMVVQAQSFEEIDCSPRQVEMRDQCT